MGRTERHAERPRRQPHEKGGPQHLFDTGGMPAGSIELGAGVIDHSSKIVDGVITSAALDSLTTPGQPTNIILTTGITSDGRAYINATWDAVSGATSYEIRFKRASESVYSYVQTASTAGRIEGLLPDTSYNVSVQAINNLSVSSGYPADQSITTAADSSAPATPTGFSVGAGIRKVIATWTDNTESDLAKYEAQVATDSGFVTVVYTWTGRASLFAYDGDADTTYWVRVRAIDTSGNASAYTAGASATTGKAATADFQDLSITNAKIGNLAVDSAKIADASIVTAKIADLNVTNAKIADATIQSAKIVSLVADKIAAGSLVVTIDITTGRLRTASSGQRVELDSAGVRLYNSSGTAVVNLDATTGNATFKGDITSGSTITGATIRTAASPAARMEMDANGLKSYDGTNTQVADFGNLGAAYGLGIGGVHLGDSTKATNYSQLFSTGFTFADADGQARIDMFVGTQATASGATTRDLTLRGMRAQLVSRGIGFSLDAAEATTNWSATNGTLARDTTNKVAGTSSMKITPDGTANRPILNLTLPAGYFKGLNYFPEVITFWLRPAFAAAANDFTVRLEQDGSNYWSFNLRALPANTWTAIDLSPRWHAGRTKTGSPNIANVVKLRVFGKTGAANIFNVDSVGKVYGSSLESGQVRLNNAIEVSSDGNAGLIFAPGIELLPDSTEGSGDPTGSTLIYLAAAGDPYPLKIRQVYDASSTTGEMGIGVNSDGTFSLDNVTLIPDLRYAQGRVSSASITANQTFTAQADVTGLSVTFTAVAGRKYRITFKGRFSNNTAATTSTAFILKDGAAFDQGQVAHANAGGPGQQTLQFSSEDAPAAGSRTYKIQVAASAGTTTLVAGSTEKAYISVEDIGTT